MSPSCRKRKFDSGVIHVFERVAQGLQWVESGPSAKPVFQENFSYPNPRPKGCFRPEGVLRKIGFYPLIATLKLYFAAKDCTV